MGRMDYMSDDERREYQRKLRRKKKQAAERANGDSERRRSGVSPNSGKNGTKRPPSKKSKKNNISKTAGIVLAVLQMAASLVFIGALTYLNMLPGLYMAVIGVVLLLLFAISLVSQMVSKKNAIAGKVFSVFMIFVLCIGSFYVLKAHGAVKKISGSSYKLDKMVVAVKADDAAESITDAKSYNFGVQYAMKGDDVKKAVSSINEELGSDVTVTELAGLSEQAAALKDGSVQAIVYNEGYTGILQEAYEGYSDDVKVIYSYEIKTDVDTSAQEVAVDDTFAVYISGIDVYGAIETNSRSDVNIIAFVNPTSHQVLLVTTPRDYYVVLPGISGDQKDKLTHAGIYGVDASMTTLEQLYNTSIDFYARVNFTSLVDIVDTLGGVDVNSEYAFTTSADSGLVMNVEQGINHFDGQQALAFSRERQNVPNGDNQRGKDQQAVITAMIKKMVSPTMLVNANGIINSVSGNVDTNMSMDQIQELVKTQLGSNPSWNIVSMAAEGTGDSQYCYSYAGQPLYVTQPDEASVSAIQTAIQSVHNGDVLEGGTSTTE
ncbi:MAG: LCP family protein [Hespellia sp.]|nr:LCP family protein [Hespellia sp.]